MGCSNAKAANKADANQATLLTSKSEENAIVVKSEEQGGATVETSAATQTDSQEKLLRFLASLFEGIDKDADGKLDATELSKALSAESSLAMLLENAGFNSEFYVLEQLDSNHDGKVSWQEFKALLENGSSSSPEKTDNVGAESSAATQTDSQEKLFRLLASLFEGIDKDADGKLDATELSKALSAESSLATLLENAGFDPHFYVLEQLDSNHDGKVSWQEFKALLENGSASSSKERAEQDVDKADEQLPQSSPEVRPVMETTAAPKAGCWC